MDAHRIRALLHYAPESGILTWLINRGAAKAGQQAGYVNSAGYRRVSIDGREHAAHRLAWVIHYGQWPQHEIDHINGVKDDNRIASLRDISVQANRQNLLRAKVTNKSSGLLGVSRAYRKDTWKAQIRINGRIKHLGYFKDPEAAHQAYLKAKRINHPSCTI